MEARPGKAVPSGTTKAPSPTPPIGRRPCCSASVSATSACPSAIPWRTGAPCSACMSPAACSYGPTPGTGSPSPKTADTSMKKCTNGWPRILRTPHPRTNRMISTNQILSTYQIIQPHIRRTPIIDVDAADFGVKAARLVLKLESLQHAGSFKSRGAFTHLLTRSVPAAGVVAASGGNHGAAVAYAAMKRQVPAKIFVPKIASSAKIQQISDYGADLVIGGERYADALAASEAWVAQSGALPIHAYDQEETLLGQGTVGLELEEQASDITTLLVAAGGGGLTACIASWFHGRIKVVGVEPEQAPTLARALAAGRPVDAEAGGIAADSL